MTIPEDPTTVSLPTRKEANIDIVVCTENLCFAAVPKERFEAHQQWHEKRRRSA